MTLTVAALSELDRPAFVAALEGVFEHSPWVAERAWLRRPFADRADLLRALVEAMRAADPVLQVALIRAHPELAGRAAAAGELTAESTKEQRGAGLNACSRQEVDTLRDLNARYRERFGFPFVIAVKGLSPADIVATMRSRLERTQAAEHDEALEQIGRIAGFRLDAKLSA